MEPVRVLPGEGEVVSERAGRTVRILVEHQLIDVTWSRYEPGERGPDPHVHRDHVDAFYVLDGDLEFGLGPDVELVTAPAGTFVLVPPNVVHTFGNEGSGKARFLNFHAPSTGFAASLRGERDGFDSFDPPADGGRGAEAVILSGPDAGEQFHRKTHAITLRGDTPQLSANTIIFEPPFVVDPHVHDDHVDSFFVLEGEVEFTLGERPVHAGPGTAVAALPGSRHGFRNAGSARARILNVHAPDAGFADSVRRRSAPTRHAPR